MKLDFYEAFEWLDSLQEAANKKSEYKDKFLDRTKKHIERVNKYGAIINKNYPDHDHDKLTTLFNDYSLMMKKDIFGSKNSKDNFSGLTEEEGNRINHATLIHITTNAHHPEYWLKEQLITFDRTNPPLALDCTEMPKFALEEMCADWCAMSEEFGNTPFEWLNKTVPSRWIFNDEQIKYIKNILHKMWD